MKRVVAFTLATVTALSLTLGLIAGPASAAPSDIPSLSVAETELSALTVAAETNADTYDRDLFPHWITISGTCNTRETVLMRDGTDVVTNSSCAATSGSWYSPYDGETWYAASDVDIDHMVPLSEAWRSGAYAWTTSKRRSFANDLTNAQLWAVTDNVNQAKGDQDPSTWRPSLTSFWCTYAKAWIDVKYEWGLTLQSSEKTALTTMLGYC